MAGYIYGSSFEPSKLIKKAIGNTADGKDDEVALIPSPAYDDWIAYDEQMVRWIKYTVCKEVVSRVVKWRVKQCMSRLQKNCGMH